MGNTEAYAFKKDFEARSGDTVRYMVMARAFGSADALDAAGLALMPGKKDLWGILIFCEKSLHFFVHPSENAMSALFRAAARAEPPKEQWARFLPGCLADIRVPEKKRGLSALFSSGLARIEVSFFSGADARASGRQSPAEESEKTGAEPFAREKPFSLCFESVTPVKDGELRAAAESLLCFRADSSAGGGKGEN